MESDQRNILEAKLASILGMDDGAGDLLDHLLTIDNLDDLKEYLSQLLGSLSSSGLEFLEDVAKFKRGDELAPVEKPKTPTTSEAQTEKEIDKKPSLPPPMASQPGRNSSEVRPTSSATKQPMQTLSKTKKDNVRTRKKNPPSTSSGRPTQSEKPALPTKSVSSKPHPQGKAKIECGCFGTQHEALVNCLKCGRIACVKEGYDFCNFCGYLLMPPTEPSAGDPSYDSWMLKEKMLGFQGNRAKRTVVYDDQADLFGTEKNEWLTREERVAVTNRQDERREELLHGGKVQLNLGVSNNS